MPAFSELMYETVREKGTKRRKCRVCAEPMSWKTSNSTLKKHFKGEHPKDYDALLLKIGPEEEKDNETDPMDTSTDVLTISTPSSSSKRSITTAVQSEPKRAKMTDHFTPKADNELISAVPNQWRSRQPSEGGTERLADVS